MKNAEVIVELDHLDKHRAEQQRIERRIRRIEKEIVELRARQREVNTTVSRLESVTDIRGGLALKDTTSPEIDERGYGGGTIEPVGDNEHRYASVYLSQHTKSTWLFMAYDRRVEEGLARSTSEVLRGGSACGLGSSWDYETAVKHAEAWVIAGILTR